jgi:hypothetical protein
MLGQSAAKKHAPESRKTQKAREKLLESFKKQDAQITGEALKATVEKIHKWISDQHKHRVLIKNKLIQLFDQNQNAAETSEKVKEFAQMLQSNSSEGDKEVKHSLYG